MSSIFAVVQRLYWKIAPPRVPSIIFLFVYLSTLVAGIIACLNLPAFLVAQLGTTLVTVFGIFILLGSLLATFGVLPGIHWLEQSGIIFIVTAVIMYTCMLIAVTSTTTIALWLVIPLILVLLQRYLEVTFGHPYSEARTA